MRRGVFIVSSLKLEIQRKPSAVTLDLRVQVPAQPYQSSFTAITASRPAALRPDTQAVKVPAATGYLIV